MDVRVHHVDVSVENSIARGAAEQPSGSDLATIAKVDAA
jgi:hypothetical protein